MDVGLTTVRTVALKAALGLSLVAACSDDAGEATSDGSTGTAGTTETTDTSGEPEAPNPFQEVVDRGLADYLGAADPSDVEERDGYTQYGFDSSDGPRCLRGDPYQMAVRPGSGDALMIYLQGGGACWSDLCQAFETAPEGVPRGGILNDALATNPASGWNVGYVPYCDGALFAGDIDIDEDGDGTIDRYHRGLQNLSAALDVIHDEFPDPSRVLVVGTSAGAYGTIIGAMLVRTVYREVPVDVLADAGIGLGKPGDEPFIRSLLDEWNVSRLLPDSCESCLADGHITPLITWALDQDPDMRYAGISSYEDLIIGTVFLEIGGAAYAEVVASETAALEQAHPDRYSRFLFAGTRHTTVAIDSTTDLSGAGEGAPLSGLDPETLETLLGVFDETEVEGTTVAAWTRAWLDNDAGFTSLVGAP